MRAYHQAVADFVPPPGAVWREGGTYSPGLIIGHNDTDPNNAAWHQGTLAGFFNGDFAGPATPAWDLAFAAFSWVPLHARHVVAAEGLPTSRPGPADSTGFSAYTAGRQRKRNSSKSCERASKPMPTESAISSPQASSVPGSSPKESV